MKNESSRWTVLCVCLLLVLPVMAAQSAQISTERQNFDVFNASYDQIFAAPVPSANEQMRSHRSLAMATNASGSGMGTFHIPFEQLYNMSVVSSMGQTDPGQGGYTDEQIAEMINNPLGNLWLMFTQHDVTWWKGDLTDGDHKVMHSFKILPVMPLKWTEEWSLILRPVIQFNSYTAPTGFSGTPPSPDFDRESGLGDTILMASFSNQTEPPYVFGFGPTFMFPTATDDMLGTEKWAAGPSVLGMYIGEKWIMGAVVQHWWSFAGDADRANVNLTDIQPILRYRLSPETNLGVAPNIQYNWDIEQWTVPIGMGFDTLIKIGPLPVKIGVEYYHYVEQSDLYGSDWGLRFLFVPVIPSPGWAKSPIF